MTGDSISWKSGDSFTGRKDFTEKKVHSSWIVHIKFASTSEKSEDKQQKKKTYHTNVEPAESDSNGSKSKDEENDEENDEDGNISKYWKFRENLKMLLLSPVRMLHIQSEYSEI